LTEISGYLDIADIGNIKREEMPGKGVKPISTNQSKGAKLNSSRKKSS
jgi:hypothetical protein